MKKSKMIYFAAFALLFSQAIFGQTDVVKPQQGSTTNVIQLEKVMTIPVKTQTVRYSFDVPVGAKYCIQSADKFYHRYKFRLFKNQKKVAESSDILGIELEIGSYILEVTSENDKSFSFIVTLNTSYSMETPQSYEKWTMKERQAQFAKAKAIPLSENIEVETAKEEEEKYFSFKVPEAARYQISLQWDGDPKEKIPYFRVFNDRYREIIHLYSTKQIGLIPGIYYISLTAHSINGTISFIILNEGDEGFKEETWLSKFEKESPMMYMLLFGLVGALIPLILYYAAFRPYSRYLKREYDIKFIGYPFYAMLAAVVVVIFLENRELMVPRPLEITLLIVCDILTMIWMCVSHYRKSQSTFLTVVDVLMIHLAYVLLFVFVAAASALAIVAIFAIAIAAIIIVMSLFTGSTLAGGGGGSKCPKCGARKSAGSACPNCGDW